MKIPIILVVLFVTTNCYARPIDDKAHAVWSKLNSLGIKARITEIYRPQSRQDWLYAQGRTRPGRILTYTKHSKHTDYRAFDIAIFTRSGKLCTNSREYAILGALAEELGLTWGGNWKMRDCMHMEMK